MTSDDLLKKLHDDPFKPFRIRMVNSKIFDVAAPWMMMVGDGRAIVATEIGKTDRGHEIALDWKTVSIDHMMEFAGPATPANRSRRKP